MYNPIKQFSKLEKAVHYFNDNPLNLINVPVNELHSNIMLHIFNGLHNYFDVRILEDEILILNVNPDQRYHIVNGIMNAIINTTKMPPKTFIYHNYNNRRNINFDIRDYEFHKI